MYLVFEYLTYLTLVVVFGLALFTVAVTLLISREGARIAAPLARRAATRVTGFASRHISALSSLSLQRSHQER
jgi:hypothetical protein